MTYDAAGHLLTATWYASNGTTVNDTLTFSYDLAGLLLTAANAQGTYTFTYDGAGQVLTVQEPFGLTLTFTYDLAGNRVKVVDSVGGEVDSTFDAAGQLVSRTFFKGASAARVDLAHDASGNVATMTRYADLAGTQLVGKTVNGFNGGNQIVGMLQQNAAGTTIDSFGYAYDVASRITSETNQSVVTNYGYDPSGQLTAAGATAYSYDANGNRTINGYTTGPDNRLLSDGTSNYTYDNEGDLIQKVNIATSDKWVYVYDNLNHMVSAVETKADGTLEVQANYKYDVFGNRLEKDVTTGGTTTVTRFAYDGWNPAKATPVGNENFDIWADLDQNSSLTTRYLRGDVVDQVFAQIGATGQAQWLLSDHLGSVRDVTDSAGVVLNHIDFTAFGAIAAQSNPAVSSRYLYVGREFDSETGLLYVRDRYQDLGTGRFTSEDRKGFDAGDPNLYRDVRNAPTNSTDPSGREESTTQADGFDPAKFDFRSPSMKQADEERKQSRLLDQLDIAAASSKMKLGIAFTSDAEFRFLLLGAGINQASDQATAWRLRAAEISQEKSQPGSTVFRFLANMNRHIGEQEAVAALARTQWKADEKRRNTLYVYFQPDGGETRGLAVTNWEGARVIQSQLEKADLAIAQSREPSFMGGVFKGLRIAGNVAQIAIGAAWIYTTGGLGAYAGGSYLVLRGADGLLSELTGQETLSSRALRAIGGDDFGAAGESVLAVTDIILSLKAPLGKLKVGQELDFAASLGKGGRIGQLVVDGGGLALSASHIGLQVADVVEVSADVAKVLGLGTSSGRLIMMMQTQRTPAENRQARNRFKNNKDAARGAWEEETGQKWPTDENGNLWPAEHAPPLKEGGDPMRVKPRDPGLPDPHNIPGSDGLTDYQRWGALGTPARVGKK